MENVKSIMETTRNTIENSVFCYAKKDGQGFIEKAKCQCYLEGKKCLMLILNKWNSTNYSVS
ncbi:hypothetical protein [Heyndrickxia ginsengihumi]|uniref:hypothetical protein n=1 Tax=Heyndrickxia ginsengihumi TaxID=363870 RepID=UPI0004729FD9|nr:hypothetical protein [Heyndrickxia ginsengihumi]